MIHNQLSCVTKTRKLIFFVLLLFSTSLFATDIIKQENNLSFQMINYLENLAPAIIFFEQSSKEGKKTEVYDLGL